MDFKSIRKSVGRLSGWLGLNLCSLIIKILPRVWLYGFARLIAVLGYRIAQKQRKIALESLSFAFGKEKAPKELEDIARKCFEFMAKSGVELVFLMGRPALIRKRVRLEGRENLNLAFAKGRGVILVSAHFGNFPLLLARLSLEGYRTAGIMRPMRDARVEKIFFNQRQKFNIKTIYSLPRKACVEASIESLRNNELLFIPLDQNFGTGGVFVNFFGREAATATGPVVLSQRTKAAIVPCFIIRQKDDSHKIIFEEPLELDEGAPSKDAILDNTQKITTIIERYIRKYPAEWGWIHRRWKSRPN